MEPSSERTSPEPRVGPTVSKDKWVNHAKTKLTRGYVLIVGTTRRTANFYSREKGYEMCAYNVARQLVKGGAVVKTGEHQLGDVYQLLTSPAVDEEAPRPRRSVREEDIDVLLEQLERERPDLADDTPAPPAA